MVSGTLRFPTIVVDGICLDLNRAPLIPGDTVKGPEKGARVVLTMPTFDGWDSVPARRFSELVQGAPQSWLCLAVSLDYAPIRKAWGEAAGWSTPAVEFGDFKEQFGVFVPRLGLLVPALFVIDASDCLLHCQVAHAFDGSVNFEAARDVLLG